MIAATLLLALPTLTEARIHTPPHRQPAGDQDYVAALSVANKFLYACQTGDSETGLLLLTAAAKKRSTEEQVHRFFSDGSQATYEISRGRKLATGRYAFPVVLYHVSDTQRRPCRPRYSLITIVKTGKDDWAVDTLP